MGGVGARLVERFHRRQICAQFGFAQVLELYLAGLLKEANATPGQQTHENSRAYLVSSTVEPAKDPKCVFHVLRFSNDFTFEANERVCGQNNGGRIPPRRCHAFAKGIPNSQLARGQVWIEPFLHILPNNPKGISRLGQELFAAGRSRSQQQQWLATADAHVMDETEKPRLRPAPVSPFPAL